MKKIRGVFLGAVFTFIIGTLIIGGYFAINKIKNDTSIAADTKRVADALDEQSQKFISLKCGLQKDIWGRDGKKSWNLTCSEQP
jgi:hypothetical protein